MRVTRIEVFGFKSFMDRLVLPLNAGISGVVGPNGCGKSNIVDALRWVLGETRARNLRGAIAEDVIFNGTEKLRPLGLAEVTLTLAAQNKSFFEDILSPGLEADSVIKAVQFENELESLEEEIERKDSKGEENQVEKSEEVTEESENKTEKPAPKLTVIDGGASGRAREAHAASLADKFSWLRSTNEV
ncbi:MAG: AAA family ATPase [bacterium]|nr:AAA family ATPase [bacterium]